MAHPSGSCRATDCAGARGRGRDDRAAAIAARARGPVPRRGGVRPLAAREAVAGRVPLPGLRSRRGLGAGPGAADPAVRGVRTAGLGHRRHRAARQPPAAARLARLLADLFGLSISEGALAGMLADSAPAFALQAGDIRRRLLSGTVLQSDETSVRVGNRTFWARVFHHGDSACFAIRPSRGKAVVAAFLGDVRPAFWVSDRLAAQMGWAAREHQVCLAHLLRDVRYALEAGDDALAPRLMALLKAPGQKP